MLNTLCKLAQFYSIEKMTTFDGFSWNYLYQANFIAITFPTTSQQCCHQAYLVKLIRGTTQLMCDRIILNVYVQGFPDHNSERITNFGAQLTKSSQTQ